jgi:hypothetical protein
LADSDVTPPHRHIHGIHAIPTLHQPAPTSAPNPRPPRIDLSIASSQSSTATTECCSDVNVDAGIEVTGVESGYNEGLIARNEHAKASETVVETEGGCSKESRDEDGNTVNEPSEAASDRSEETPAVEYTSPEPDETLASSQHTARLLLHREYLY